MENNAKNIIEKYGVLPVINITDSDKSVPLAGALIEGGLPLIEVTLRSESSLLSIKLIKEAYPDMLVGAGTVLTPDSVDAAVEAGAGYIVSPGYDPELVRYCVGRGIAITPGCSTASEIQDAVKNGIDVVKFFPSELSGGIKAIKLLAGPFPNVRFLPTGGINLGNLEDYLSCEKVIACGGSFMADSAMIKNSDFSGITAACKKAVELSLGLKLAHIGINHSNRAESEKSAQTIADIFGFATRSCSASVFAGNIAECMDHTRYGEHGHIGISTHSMVRAMNYLEMNGVEFDTDSIKHDSAGNITCIYLKKQVAGFALHIVKD